MKKRGTLQVLGPRQPFEWNVVVVIIQTTRLLYHKWLSSTRLRHKIKGRMQVRRA